MTFLNNHHPTKTTVLPDFQYLTSPSDEQPISTTSHIPFNPLPKSVDVNQYGNNITNNTTHVIIKSLIITTSKRTFCSRLYNLHIYR